MTFQELKRNSKKAAGGAPVLRVAVLGDTSTQLLVTALKGMAYARGFNLSVFESEFSQIEIQISDTESEYHRFGADYTVIFQSTHKLMDQYYHLLDTGAAGTLAEARIQQIREICGRINGKVIYLNYPEIDDSVFGSYANKVESSFIFQVRKLNYLISDLSVKNANLFICDLSSLQNIYGRKFMFDASVYTTTEMILSIDSLPEVSSRIMDIICALRGVVKKCLVLDLDNTVWGGTVGDDGWENIQVGHGLGIGQAFTEFQQWIRKLKDRGIIITVCSKNDEEKAKEPFEKNPELVLRLEDIAVFVANWETKVDNIRMIRQVLNIGFDSMVFIDDNPFERSMVRENIEGICVPELPEDPSEYLEFFYSLNLFETASYSQADGNRTAQYRMEARRISAKKTFTSETDFLRSLGMVSSVSGFTAFNIPRVAQLSQRSNQFNLRTVRYTEKEVTEIENSGRFKTFAFTLADKFGDNGLICVVILEKRDDGTLFIDTWFMSCRVLKRGMEQFTLNVIVKYARENGFGTIVGEYIPTPKNAMVAGLYESLGFETVEPGRLYRLPVEDYSDRECCITARTE